MEGIQVIYGRDPGNTWKGSRYYVEGIQVLCGSDPGIMWKGSRYYIRGLCDEMSSLLIFKIF